MSHVGIALVAVDGEVGEARSNHVRRVGTMVLEGVAVDITATVHTSTL